MESLGQSEALSPLIRTKKKHIEGKVRFQALKTYLNKRMPEYENREPKKGLIACQIAG